MPIIKARTHRVRVVRHICRLQEPTRETLVLYARFIGDTADYVLNQVIESTLGKDRDFLAWRTGQTGGARDAMPARPPITEERPSAASRG